MEQQFERTWNIWYHHEKDNWKLNGYKKIYTIENIKDFWKLYNNWNKLGGISVKHYFIMQDGATPIWEDSININGGCWSFKILGYQCKELWEDLSTLLVSEEITENKEIVGLSVCQKKNGYSVIKIWNKDSKKNSLGLLNEKILNKWGTNIIYIAHMPDKNIL